jgi:hypothetical protein
MGLEYIVQPQVFLGGLTALGPGIQGLTEQYPLLTTYYSWTSTASVNTSSFPIPIAVGSIYNGPGKEASFIVSLGSVVQSPTEYTVDPILRTITFSSVVSAGIEVAATQLATAAPSSQNFNFLKSVSSSIINLSALNGNIVNLSGNTVNIINGYARNLLVTNLTALSTFVNVIDIQVSEVSGFRVMGDVNVNGNVFITNNLFLTGNVVANNITSTFLQSNSGNIISLTATNLTIPNLTSTNLITTNANINSLTATNLQSSTGIITSLTATNLQSSTGTVSSLSANALFITSPILSTNNSTQVSTTNFVRQFGGFQNIAVYTTGTSSVNIASLGPGIEKIKVTVVGGGGGGGNSKAANSAGGGGGSGGVTISYINNISLLGTSFSYVVGNGGGPNPEDFPTGRAGQGSSFTIGTVSISANGGGGGWYEQVPVRGSGGSASTTGQINLAGVDGGWGILAAPANTASSGKGGSNMFGGGGRSLYGARQAGENGINNTGGGGSGAVTNNTLGHISGGSGGSGVVIVEY